MKFSLKKYSSLLFVLIGIIVLYILLNVLNMFNTKEGKGKANGKECDRNKDCDSGNCNGYKINPYKTSWGELRYDYEYKCGTRSIFK
jgi:hypothetical protein